MELKLVNFKDLERGDIYKTVNGTMLYMRIEDIRTRAGGNITSVSQTGHPFNHQTINKVMLTKLTVNRTLNQNKKEFVSLASDILKGVIEAHTFGNLLTISEVIRANEKKMRKALSLIDNK